MEESDRNWPVSVATVEQLTDRGGAKEVAGLKEEDLPSDEDTDPPTAAGSSSTLSVSLT